MKFINVLDHGSIQLIEYWGSDERVIEAARQSTGKGFLGWENDEKLLAYLHNNKHCYDESTEVLTQRGFVPWGEVGQDDLLGQWDESLNSLVYEAPFSLVKDRYEGVMYSVVHGGVDLLVTPNHKMYVKTMDYRQETKDQYWSDKWRLVTASELSNRSMVRYRKHATYNTGKNLDLRSIFPEYKNIEGLLKLIGFFIGDGHAGGTYANAITFHLKKKRKINWLRETCRSVGWELVENTKHHNYVVKAPGLTRLFRSEFYSESGDKVIPDYLLRANSIDANYLLDGLRNSDGSVKRGTWVYDTTSKQVANAVQLLVLHSGASCSISPDNRYLYRINIFSRMLEPVINQGKVNTTMTYYKGNVYCAHTRTGVLVVRRNGKIVLSGNSTPFEMCGVTIQVKAPIFIFREWHRHRTQSYAEMSARYIPMPDEHYLPSVERILEGANAVTSNKQAQGASKEPMDWHMAASARARMAENYRRAQEDYLELLALGTPKELTRLTIPVARYSKMMASANLRNWLAFLTLRNAPNAQWEIQEYARALDSILTEVFPRTMELFHNEINK